MTMKENLQISGKRDVFHLVKSKGRNHYLLSRNIPQVLLLHPVFNHILQLQTDGIDVREWLNGLEPGTVKLTEDLNTTKCDLEYYYNYYLFLKENNYFKKKDGYKITHDKYSADMIEYLLANTGKITFEVTDSCNLACGYCGYGHMYEGFDKRADKNLSLKVAMRAIDYFHERRVSQLNNTLFKNFEIGFYGGEPLLNFPFIEGIAAYARKKKWGDISLEFSITTNAVLLDKHMDFLAANNFNLLISLDGNKEHNAYRVFKNGASAFDRIYGNCIKLKNKYPDYFENHVNFLAVAHKKNSFKQVIAYFKETFNKRPMISNVSPVALKSDKIDEFRTIHNEAFSDLTSVDLAEYARDKKKRLSHPKRIFIDRFLKENTNYRLDKYSQLLGEDTPTPKRVGTCEPFRRKAFITVNGKILVCEQISQEYCLGEVDETGVRIDYREVVEKYNRWYEKMSGQCNECMKIDYCTQCIFYLNLNADDPEEYRCPSFENTDSLKERISQSLSILEDAPLLFDSIMKS